MCRGRTALRSNVHLFVSHVALGYAGGVITISGAITRSVEATRTCLPTSRVTAVAGNVSARGVSGCLSARARPGGARLGVPVSTRVVNAINQLRSIGGRTLLLHTCTLMLRRRPGDCLVLIKSNPRRDHLALVTTRLGYTTRIVFVARGRTCPCCTLFGYFILPSTRRNVSLTLLRTRCFGYTSIITRGSPRRSVVARKRGKLLMRPSGTRSLTHTVRTILRGGAMRRGLNGGTRGRIARGRTVARVIVRCRRLFAGIS